MSKPSLNISDQKQRFYKGTSFLLSDGRVKNVEDLTTDDQLMGYDGYPRQISKLSYDNVLPGKTSTVVSNSSGSGYRVEHSHKLVLTSDSDTIIGLISMLTDELKSVEIHDYYIIIDDTDYQILTDSIRDKLYGIRSVLEYKLDTVTNTIKIHPTVLGYWLGSGKLDRVMPKSHRISLAFEVVGKCHFTREWDDNLAYKVNNKFVEDTEYYGYKYNKKLLIPYDYKFAGYPVRASLFSGIVQALADRVESNTEQGLYWPVEFNEMLDDFVFLARTLGHNVVTTTQSKYFGYSVTNYLKIELNGDYYDDCNCCYCSEYLANLTPVLYPTIYKPKVTYDTKSTTHAQMYNIELVDQNCDDYDNFNGVLLNDLTVVKV